MAFKKSTFCEGEACVEVDREGFFKSSFSSGTNHCVEVNRDFKLSSFTADSGTCVAVARGDGEQITMVRNSKRPEEGCAHFTEDEWQAFIAGVKNNEFD